ncbi:MAG: hypothetical protein HYY09_04880 [Firmicutes bacterium]|nr:hypothetical protein [Bacillota bacterium]
MALQASNKYAMRMKHPAPGAGSRAIRRQPGQPLISKTPAPKRGSAERKQVDVEVAGFRLQGTAVSPNLEQQLHHPSLIYKRRVYLMYTLPDTNPALSCGTYLALLWTYGLPMIAGELSEPEVH